MAKRRRNLRWVKWLLALGCMLAIIIVVVVVINNNAQNETKNENKEQQAMSVNDAEETGESKQGEKTVQYEGESPNKSETLTGLISYAGVINNKLTIRVSIDQFLSTGNCNLKLSKDGTIYYSQSVEIQDSVTTSVCDGFEIPSNGLPSGAMKIEVALESDDRIGKIEGEVNL